MDDFSFRRLREKETLRYSKEDVKRQQKELSKSQQSSPKTIYVRKLHSSRSEFQTYSSKKLSDYEDPLFLKAEFLRYQSEIQQILFEVEPLRDKFQKLLDQTQDRGNQPIIYHKQSSTEIDVHDLPLKYHVSAKQFYKLKQEHESIKEEKNELRYIYSNHIVDRYQKAVETAEQEVAFLNLKIQELQDAEESIRYQILDHKLSDNYTQAKKRERKYKALKQKVQLEVQNHQILKKAYYELKENEGQLEQAQMAHLNRLEEKLAAKRLKLNKTKEKYIKLRNRQIQECKSMGEKIELQTIEREKQNQIDSGTQKEEFASSFVDFTQNESKKLWAGYFKSKITKKQIKKLFEGFGNLIQINVALIDDNGYEAILDYSVLDWPLESIQEQFTDITVVEYDQRPTSQKKNNQGKIMEVVTIEPEKIFSDSLRNLPSDVKIPDNINAPIFPKHEGHIDIDSLLNSTSKSSVMASSEPASEEDGNKEEFLQFFTEIGSKFGNPNAQLTTIKDGNQQQKESLNQKQIHKDTAFSDKQTITDNPNEIQKVNNSTDALGQLFNGIQNVLLSPNKQETNEINSNQISSDQESKNSKSSLSNNAKQNRSENSNQSQEDNVMNVSDQNKKNSKELIDNSDKLNHTQEEEIENEQSDKLSNHSQLNEQLNSQKQENQINDSIENNSEQKLANSQLIKSENANSQQIENNSNLSNHSSYHSELIEHANSQENRPEQIQMETQSSESIKPQSQINNSEQNQSNISEKNHSNKSEELQSNISEHNQSEKQLSEQESLNSESNINKSEQMKVDSDLHENEVIDSQVNKTEPKDNKPNDSQVIEQLDDKVNSEIHISQDQIEEEESDDSSPPHATSEPSLNSSKNIQNQNENSPVPIINSTKGKNLSSFSPLPDSMSSFHTPPTKLTVSNYNTETEKENHDSSSVNFGDSSFDESDITIPNTQTTQNSSEMPQFHQISDNELNISNQNLDDMNKSHQLNSEDLDKNAVNDNVSLSQANKTTKNNLTNNSIDLNASKEISNQDSNKSNDCSSISKSITNNSTQPNNEFPKQSTNLNVLNLNIPPKKEEITGSQSSRVITLTDNSINFSTFYSETQRNFYSDKYDVSQQHSFAFPKLKIIKKKESKIDKSQTEKEEYSLYDQVNTPTENELNQSYNSIQLNLSANQSNTLNSSQIKPINQSFDNQLNESESIQSNILNNSKSKVDQLNKSNESKDNQLNPLNNNQSNVDQLNTSTIDNKLNESVIDGFSLQNNSLNQSIKDSNSLLQSNQIEKKENQQIDSDNTEVISDHPNLNDDLLRPSSESLPIIEENQDNEKGLKLERQPSPSNLLILPGASMFVHENTRLPTTEEISTLQNPIFPKSKSKFKFAPEIHRKSLDPIMPILKFPPKVESPRRNKQVNQVSENKKSDSSESSEWFKSDDE